MPPPGCVSAGGRRAAAWGPPPCGQPHTCRNSRAGARTPGTSWRCMSSLWRSHLEGACSRTYPLWGALRVQVGGPVGAGWTCLLVLLVRLDTEMAQGWGLGDVQSAPVGGTGSWQAPPPALIITGTSWQHPFWCRLTQSTPRCPLPSVCVCVWADRPPRPGPFSRASRPRLPLHGGAHTTHLLQQFLAHAVSPPPFGVPPSLEPTPGSRHTHRRQARRSPLSASSPRGPRPRQPRSQQGHRRRRSRRRAQDGLAAAGSSWGHHSSTGQLATTPVVPPNPCEQQQRTCPPPARP